MVSKPRASARLSVLTRRRDFLHLLKHGERVRASDWLLLNFSKNEEGKLRCGWTLPRQVGTAVVRNRLRRWARIYFRARLKISTIEDETIPQIDVNLVFRKAPEDFYKKLKYETFSDVLDKAWAQVERKVKSPVSTGYRPLQGHRGRSPGRGVPV